MISSEIVMKAVQNVETMKENFGAGQRVGIWKCVTQNI